MDFQEEEALAEVSVVEASQAAEPEAAGNVCYANRTPLFTTQHIKNERPIYFSIKLSYNCLIKLLFFQTECLLII